MSLEQRCVIVGASLAGAKAAETLRSEGFGGAQGVRSTDGLVIEGDLVVVGVGVSPRDELAQYAGLTLQNGIVVDELLRTSAPDIFYSDQYDLGMEYHGYASDWDRVVIRGDLAGRQFLAFWLKDGRVLASMNANLWDQGEGIKALVRSGATVDADRLGDPSTSLADATFRA